MSRTKPCSIPTPSGHAAVIAAAGPPARVSIRRPEGPIPRPERMPRRAVGGAVRAAQPGRIRPLTRLQAVPRRLVAGGAEASSSIWVAQAAEEYEEAELDAAPG